MILHAMPPLFADAIDYTLRHMPLLAFRHAFFSLRFSLFFFHMPLPLIDTLFIAER